MSHAADDEPDADPDLDADEAVPFVKTVYQGITETNVTFMAASIAYQAFVSLVPLLVLVFLLVTVVGDEALAQRVTATTEGFLPQSGQELIAGSIEGEGTSAGASVVGLVTLVWGALKIFRGLDVAFSEIYGTTSDNSFVDSIRDGLVVFGAIAFALVAAGVTTIAFAVLPEIPFLGVVNPLALVVVLSLAFYPMYYFFPDASVTAREVVPGVVVAAVGWAALQGLFQVYVSLAGGGAGEALGAIVLLLTWLYFGGLVLLVGAVVNAAYGGKLAADEPVPLEEAAAGEPAQGAPPGRGADGQAGATAAGGAPGPFAAARLDRERERYERRVAALERERDQLRADLETQRSRRYALEDEVDDLRRRLESVERENERLRRQVTRRHDPPWRRALGRLTARFDDVSVGTIRTRGRE